jgi:alanine racemase
MSGVVLHLDVERWRSHQRVVAEATAGIVPVAKGNGYGFGLRRLAEEAALLGVDTLAVGTAGEVAAVREAFGGHLVVLAPWRPGDPVADRLLGDPRVITTVSRLGDLQAVADRGDQPRVLVEVLTSMRRYGVAPEELAAVAPLLDRVRFEGWTIHLPLRTEGRYAEAERLARAALAAAPGPLWLSHLPADEARSLAVQLGGAGGDPVPVRLRLGTRLWLGDPQAYGARAAVVDVHPVERGERIGYRQRKAPGDGWVVVVAGGTAHGIGLEAPTAATSARQRAVAVATGSLEAVGLALSPYTIGGKKRWFIEPPHMQSSQVFLPRSVPPPEVGDEVPVELRLTTAVVDEIRPATLPR